MGDIYKLTVTIFGPSGNLLIIALNEKKEEKKKKKRKKKPKPYRFGYNGQSKLNTIILKASI